MGGLYLFLAKLFLSHGGSLRPLRKFPKYRWNIVCVFFIFFSSKEPQKKKMLGAPSVCIPTKAGKKNHFEATGRQCQNCRASLPNKDAIKKEAVV